MRKEINIIIPIFILCLISIITLFINNQDYCFKQLIWFCCGFILLFGNKYWNNNIIRYSKYLYYFNLLLLGLVLIVGKEINGARAWFSFKLFSFQPSELMKLSIALYLNNIFNIKDKFYLIKSLLIVIVPSILVFIEPDTGAIIMYLIIYISMFFYSLNNKKIIKYLIGWLFFIGVVFFLLLKFNIININFGYRFDRIVNINNNYQINNALISLGSSSLLLRDKSNIYVPESLTDFMFVKASSDLGYIISIIILISYFIVLLLIFKYSNNDLFNISFFWLFFFQVSYNILMNIGVFPIMGIPIPFLSYGGTNTIIYFLFLSIFLSNIKRSFI